MNSQAITTPRRLVTNSAFSVVSTVGTGLATFFLIPLLLVKLGEQKYGVWVLIGSVFSYSAILHLGLSSAINRFIPVFLARGDEDGIRRVISTGTAFFVIVSLALASATAAVYFNLTRWFAIPPEQQSVSRMTALIVGMCSCLAVSLQGFGAVLSGYQRYDILGRNRLIAVGMRTALVILLLSRGYGLLALALIYGAAEIAVSASNMFSALHTLRTPHPACNSVDIPLLKEMLGYGINTFLYGVAAIIIYKASEMVIGVLLRTEDVARYSLASSALLMLSSLVESFSAAIKPAISDLDARNDSIRIREISFLSQKYILLLSIPCAAFFFLMGRDFLIIWTHKQVPQLSLVLSLLTIGHFVRLAQYSNFLVLVGSGEHRLFGILTLVMAGLTIVLSVISIKCFAWGLAGVALANMLPMLAVCGLVIPIYFNRKMGITLRESFDRVWRPSLAGTSPVIAVLAAWKIARPPHTWLEIVAIIATAVFITCLASWKFSMKSDEKSRFLRAVVPSPSRAQEG